MHQNPLVDPRELERLHAQSWSWALTCTRGRRSEAEDVLQMSYLAILEGRARFDGASSLRTWLFAVIRNHARSRWRMLRRTLDNIGRLASFSPADDDAAREDSPETAYGRAKSAGQVLAAWNALPARQREILDLVFYRGLSIAEAASVMRVTLGTARIHYERGKATLRRKLVAEESQ